MKKKSEDKDFEAVKKLSFIRAGIKKAKKSKKSIRK